MNRVQYTDTGGGGLKPALYSNDKLKKKKIYGQQFMHGIAHHETLSEHSQYDQEHYLPS
jgi:hypothetical protein